MKTAAMTAEPKPLPCSTSETPGSSDGLAKRHSLLTPSCAQKTFSSWLR